MNGRYYLDGEYQGKPRYKHAVETDLYLRVGGNNFWGYGISGGREAVNGNWAYFCQTSHNQADMRDVPDKGNWVSHGGFGANDPPPAVVVRPVPRCRGSIAGYCDAATHEMDVEGDGLKEGRQVLANACSGKAPAEHVGLPYELPMSQLARLELLDDKRLVGTCW
jgi:hypothetical protein